MNLKVLIVDDEQDSRDTLENYLSKYCNDVTIVDKCENIAAAKKVIEKSKIDILFLDVEMPFGNGFDLLDSLEKVDFEVIFVTAFSHYAIKALNLSASYYLLKPVDIDELVESVERVRKNLESSDWIAHTKVLIDNLSQVNKQNQKIIMPLIDGFEVKNITDVVYCKAEDNFTRFFLTDGTELLICRTLKHYEEALVECGFCRIHRSYLINLEYVTKYNKGKGGFVTMNNGKELEVSATKKNGFLEAFGVK